MRNQKVIFITLLIFFSIIGVGRCEASMFADFDFLNNDVTQGFGNWNYSDIGENPSDVYNGENQSKLYSDPDSSGDMYSISYYYNGYNSDHMGWMRWGYIDSSTTAISGNSLKIGLTGGAYDNQGAVAYSGLEIRSKSQLENYLNQSLGPYANRVLPGDLSLYIRPTQTLDHYRSFEPLEGSDRLSVWMLPPEESQYTLDNQMYSVDYGRPQNLFSWYPFVVDSNGDHYYHELNNINMGGWVHLVFDAHPVHNNGGDSNPYSYYRAGGYEFPGNPVGYFNNVNNMALRAPIVGNLQSPAYLYMDELEAYKVSQPENDETIAGIGVGYDPSGKIFDISFNDKYRCAECDAKYEVKYSFSPITNANYSTAKIPSVINFRRENNNGLGEIYKPEPGYSQIWAALEVQENDKANLIEGATIYFAVKDISDRSNLSDRDTYELETVNVDGLGQIRRIDLVKTIDYTIYPLYRELYFEDQNVSSGHVGEIYNEQIYVKGGVRPYSFILESGSLPAGLALSQEGIISGTPQQLGTYAFRVRVNESSSFDQTVSKDFTLDVYNPENCTDGIDNDHNRSVDCADSACFTSSICSEILVDFAQPNVFGLDNWNTLLKDAYTGYVTIGPGGMATTIGSNGSYNFQGVQGVYRNFILGDRILVSWYNNSSADLTFTPRVSFNDNDRIESGTVGNWYYMSEITVAPHNSAISEFVFDATSSGAYDLVNINSNHTDNQISICDKINLVPFVSSNNSRSDVDGSSTTSTTDALLTLRNSLGLSMTSTAWQAGATTGDVDCNGAANSTDALLILRYSIGLNMGETGWCE